MRPNEGYGGCPLPDLLASESGAEAIGHILGKGIAGVDGPYERCIALCWVW